MKLLGENHSAVIAAAVEGRGSIRNNKHFKTQVPRHADGGGNAVVRGEADHEQGRRPGSAQPGLEVCSDKRGVDGLLNEGLAAEWAREILEGISTLTRAERGSRLGGHVLHVDDGSRGRAPRIE